MKIKINRNILWAETFVRNLAAAGVKHSCISPGSRSTPLTYAFASEPSIKSFVNIDERSSAFFATGLARKTQTPVALVCTSGTAVAEFYPAIIEAYQQRIPLVICTADRPSGSFQKGMNQTINQQNIFRNHIRWFTDAGLPDPYNLKKITEIACTACQTSIQTGGPVHINFPFDKPFEPDNYTDTLDESCLSVHIPYEISESYPAVSPEIIENTGNRIFNVSEGIITCGPSEFSSRINDLILRLSKLSGYPVLADGTSGLRFGTNDPNVLTNYDALFRGGYFDDHKPSIIIHFGRIMTSKGYEDFLMNYRGAKYLVNKWGAVFDPSSTYDALIKSDEEFFLNRLNAWLEAKGINRKKSAWGEQLKSADEKVCRLKQRSVYGAEFPDESRIITEIISLIPDSANLMVSNSSPVRDLDYFAEKTLTEFKIFHNRGASGIDGINSTALGISAGGGKTILITGDLAFYHDLNGLLIGKQYNIPLLIILINNNGGGIFRALPVSAYNNIFGEFFTTPTDLEFRRFTEAYGGKHILIKSWEHLKESFSDWDSSKEIHVLEIKTDSLKSLDNRRNFWNNVKLGLNDNITE